MVLPGDVERALSAHAGIQRIELTGSRASGRATPQSDWDFVVVTAGFTEVRDAMPRLVVPLRPVIAQWDRLSRTWCYMLILTGPVEVDLIFGQPHAALPPWQPSASTLRGIDDHFWDWLYWLASKHLVGKQDVVAQEFVRMAHHLLRPLGVDHTPETIAATALLYIAARRAAENRLGVVVSRALEDAVRPGLRLAGYDV